MKSFVPLQKLVLEHRVWAAKQFPTQTINSKLDHVKEELDEIKANPKDILEYADVALLLLDVLTLSGFTVDDLKVAMAVKHEICVQRQWNGIHHVKGPVARICYNCTDWGDPHKDHVIPPAADCMNSKSRRLFPHATDTCPHFVVDIQRYPEGLE